MQSLARARSALDSVTENLLADVSLAVPFVY